MNLNPLPVRIATPGAALLTLAVLAFTAAQFDMARRGQYRE